ncbi:unnamed protein product [Calicophoron daubneyi]|uniref:Thyroglobulin type-1 domain-containing protein n=1 Tax=Calicophoron daubneyi TaxID=300641 RepID=A0AAV2TXX3_CALDB
MLIYLGLVLTLWIEKTIVGADNGLIVPVSNDFASEGAGCQAAVQATSSDSPKRDPNYDSGSNLIDQRIVVPYIPRCQSDRPELFEARQCSQYDCFCVDVKTGETLLGTRASPSEVGDCSTAIYSILLAIRMPNYPTPGKPPPNEVGAESSLTSFASDFDTVLTPKQDADLRKRIHWGLESILRSAFGYQRITNVTQLVTVPMQQPHGSMNSGIVYYRAQLISTGHVSVKAPQDLVQHRLHEGYLPEVGDVIPDISRVELVQTQVDDPAILSVPKINDPPLSETNTVDQEEESKIQPHRHEQGSSKTVAVRSPEFGPAAPETLAEKFERESRQSDGVFGTDVEPPHLAGGVVAAKQTSGGVLYQSWPVRSSHTPLLEQPGVIAGIVGSVVVVLLLLILFILFCIYRLRKKDEGSYALDEPKKLPTTNSYTRAPTREFYA